MEVRGTRHADRSLRVLFPWRFLSHRLQIRPKVTSFDTESDNPLFYVGRCCQEIGLMHYTRHRDSELSLNRLAGGADEEGANLSCGIACTADSRDHQSFTG